MWYPKTSSRDHEAIFTIALEKLDSKQLRNYVMPKADPPLAEKHYEYYENIVRANPDRGRGKSRTSLT